MENGQKTIMTLFNGDKHFVIPKYQRAYAWDEEHLTDFIEDIRNQRLDKEYFLGTILLQDKGISSGFEQIDVVDGQQRITTLIIFMKTLLSRLEDMDSVNDYRREIRRYLKDENFYKLELIQMDNDFFKTYIIDGNEIDEKFVETPSQKRLLNAKIFFQKQLKNDDLETLKEYKKKIELTRLLTYSVNDTAEATLIFETTNDRGKSLTNLEKTKSFLMHKVYLTKNNPLDLLDSIHDRFSGIYRILEEINYQIDEDSILQYHFISHLDWGYTRKSKDYQKYVDKTKERINKLIKSNNSEKTPVFIDKYTRELKESYNVVKELLKDDNHCIRDLFILGRLRFFYPLMIKCYKIDTASDKSNFYNIIRLMEIFSFRVYGIGRKPAHTGETWLYTLAKKFKGDFDDLKYELVHNGILDYVDTALFKEKLLSPYFYSDVSSLDRKYLFWKYENYLRQNEQPIAAPMSEKEFLTQDPKCKLTIEHIAAQHRKVCTSELVLPEFDEEFEEKYMNSIGNLTFDPNSANASKGNNDIEIKNSRYFVKAPFKTQNELNDYIEGNRWTKESIDMRKDKILKFALDFWDPMRYMS